MPKLEPDDFVAGHLEVGRTDNFEVVINLPSLDVDEQGRSHICFSPRQARALAELLQQHATEAVKEWRLSRDGK